jgi:NDP-sugar pyrophosphorylase family protein
MAPIVNRPALHHILRLLAKAGVAEVVINLHHFPDAIRDWFAEGGAGLPVIRWAYEEQLLGTAGGVKNNADFLGDGTFLVMSGDSLTDLDLADLVDCHRAKGGIATLAVKEVEDPSEYGVMLVDEEDRVVGFQEKPSRSEALSNLCNCGIYVFEPAALDLIPAASFYDFGKQLFPEMVAAGLPFYVHRVGSYWNDVGNLEEYQRSNFTALRGEVAVELPGTEFAPGIRREERCSVAAGAVLMPPVLLGRDCVVEDGARLEGPVILGDCCIVEEGAVVSSCIIGSATLLGAETSIRQAILGRACQVRSAARLDEAVLGDRCLVSPSARVRGVLEANSIVPPTDSIA